MKAFKIVVVFSVSLLLSLSAFAGEVGRFSYVEGRVDVIRAGGKDTVPVVREDSVAAGDAIRTKSYSKAEIVLTDDSILRVASNTKVLVKEYTVNENNEREKAVLKLSRGKIRTISKKGANFVIDTPNASGTIKGSDIFTLFQGGRTGILVKQGSVHAYNPLFPDEIAKIGKGDALFIPMDRAPETPRLYLDVEMKLHSKDTDPPEKRRLAPRTIADLTVIEGWVSKTAGAVDIKSKGDRTWHRAEINEALGEGDRIKNGGDGTIEIRLENGNAIALGPDTEMSFEKLSRDPKTNEYENILDAKRGKLKVVAEKLKGKSKFEVKTPTAVCGIRGTIMFLDILEGLTKAYYEGGGGSVRSTLSGKCQNLQAGQNTSADNQGNVDDPRFTTNEERNDLNNTWSRNQGAEGYSSPQDNTGGAGGGFEGLGGGEGGGTEPGGTTPGKPFSDVPFEDDNILPPGSTGETGLEGELTANFGSFDEEGEFSFDGGADPKLIAILRSFVESLDDWTGPLVITLGGTYINPFDSRLWSGEVLGNTHDGAKFKGRMTGFMGSWKGVFSVIYVTPPNELGFNEAGVAFGRCPDGTDIPLGGANNNGLLFGNCSVDLNLMMNPDVGITPAELPGAMAAPESSEIELASHENSRVSLEGKLILDRYRIADGEREGWGIWEGKYFLEYDPDGLRNWASTISNEDDDDESDFYIFTLAAHDTPTGESGLLTLDMVGLSLTDYDDESGNGYRNAALFVGSAFGGYDGDEGEVFTGGGAGLFHGDSNLGNFPQGWYDDPEDLGLFIGRGTGFFMNGGVNTGTINVDAMLGGALLLDYVPEDGASFPSGGALAVGPALSFYDGVPMGIWYFTSYGTYAGPTANNWRTILGGGIYEGYFAVGDPGVDMDFIWFGAIFGTADQFGNLDGEAEGFWFSDYSAGTIGTDYGAVVGNYNAEENTWQLVGGGEWVVVTDLLDQDVFGELDMHQFVSVPITEVHSSLIAGGTGAFDAGGVLAGGLDISFYANQFGNVWASAIDGTFSGTTGDGWNMNFNDGTVDVDLAGDRWNRNKWHADVTGTYNGNAITGEAAGTYSGDDGTFTGIGGGTWEENVL